jgi:hypothetical protein
MPWSYSGDPASSDKDAVRFLLGDTLSSDEQLQDAEINFLIDQQGGNVYLAASMGANMLASKYARLVDKSVGDLRISYGSRQKAYLALSDALAAQAITSGAGLAAPYAGGISVSDKEIDIDNTDRVAPSFKKGMHDYFAPQTQTDEPLNN